MKFEIKMEPVCAVLFAIPAYAAIVIIMRRTEVQVQDSWFPLSAVVTISPSRSLTFHRNNEETMGNDVKKEHNAAKPHVGGDAGQNN